MILLKHMGDLSAADKTIIGLTCLVFLLSFVYIQLTCNKLRMFVARASVACFHIAILAIAIYDKNVELTQLLAYQCWAWTYVTSGLELRPVYLGNALMLSIFITAIVSASSNSINNYNLNIFGLVVSTSNLIALLNILLNWSDTNNQNKSSGLNQRIESALSLHGKLPLRTSCSEV